jgi:23S rRNA C2498 (ribose-2'-O)-methylase RlmM
MEWADIKMNPGENVLELGASPGGASQFLLEKGWKVYGVDPAKMDERLTSWIQQGQFIHLPSPFELLSIEDLRFTSHLIVCDINLPPSVVVREIIRLIVLMKKNAQQIPHTILINLKMTDDTFINQLEIYQKRFLELGFKRCRLKMLPSHRKEIALLAQYEGK